MTVFWHEMRQGRAALAVWTASIVFLIAVCILIYPEMGDQMDEISGMFAEMGGFSAAFGMDRINFGEFLGFFGVECGNILGLGGALFAALLGVGALAGEERAGTAELLLTHPISRARVAAQKLCAVLAQLAVLNAAASAATVACARAIGQTPDAGRLALLLGSCFLLQAEIGTLCFGVSAFLRQGGPGVGMGLAIGFYFMNLIANLTERAEFLKYLTPFAYAESADILTDGRLNAAYLCAGLLLAAAGAGAGFARYLRKDIA